MALQRLDDVSQDRRSRRRSVLGAGFGAILGLASSAVADSRKKKPKRKKKRKNTDAPTPAPPARRDVRTVTFTNTTPILFPDRAVSNSSNPAAASPYPSTIIVSGLVNGRITDINVRLSTLTSNQAAIGELDLLLTASHLPGRTALIMSDAGGQLIVTNRNYVIDDEAPAIMGSGQGFPSGTYRPGNYDADTDVFLNPAPPHDGNSTLGVFDGQDPNGSWQLWAMMDRGGRGEGILGGWALEITAEVDV